ncbi:MAG: DUF58 domain-containing protein [Hydrogenophaga sp.]|uniref:DUF58 domain-containing protein n=1 Tax=Hydrogenophaga sp. TaxID=1904254 RepID=UPI0016A0860F|nr:DUF58 domain-containing protein [Hydrogenophaga sp.]NIM42160.1 DUF58 domain-containing protein [Hydrogenophaga sp.]NIN27453.1 DUF58 domain-containing protein [Hydrogenophaga sp.]NIN32154.1 DUF58 domain-containing protein [Hydrogenophaga sp.]NIN56406.1 DUF58 domain-containing protein [Hydrogenophaga sp.]NIO52713.1 DUF58 domain-containing protein [Hydrogenophaga sp.]
MFKRLFGRAPADPPGEASKAPAAQRADALLRRLEWTVLRRLDGLLQGHYKTLMRGSGLDLADLREYQLHDDVRHIDWNVTARLQQPHVRVFTEDREMAAWFLLDLSPSVDFGSGEQRKSDVLLQFTAVLARLISGQGNRVGAMVYGSQGRARVETMLPARGGRNHVLRLMQMLMPRPTAKEAVPAGEAATRLGDLLRSAVFTVRQRSTVFVVSDFISQPGWERPLGELARRHDVVAVRLVDPLELDLPDLGLIPIRDAETGEQIVVDTHDKGFRQRFARIAAQREAQLRESLARAGVDTLELATDEDLADAVLRFVDLRERRVRQGAGGRPMPTQLPRRTREGVRA